VFLAAHREFVEVEGGAVDDCAGAAGCLDGGIEHRMHGKPLKEQKVESTADSNRSILI
jgi:hypothetical protein